MKSLSILGSTGSIGTQALEVAEFSSWQVKAITAGSNVKLLEEQIRKFKPVFAAAADEKAAADLKIRVSDTPVKVLSGPEGVCECASCGADIVLNSIVGIAGLSPTVAAINAGGVLALANKETLVAGGIYVTELAKKKGVPILPVDSEHSAIFQSLQGCAAHSQIKRLILTASGGPFFGMKKEDMKNITLEQALRHPNWSMGAKITIDSATMMNKGLELIEAARLFDVDADNIDILVHRQSIVHSLVEYADNSVIAQLGVPDMRIPIQYALTYPDRFVSPVKQLRLEQVATLTFAEPDYEAFPCINLCKRALRQGGLYPAAANAANEQANLMFRQNKIGFTDIAGAVEYVLDNIVLPGGTGIEAVLETDACARELVLSRQKGAI